MAGLRRRDDPAVPLRAAGALMWRPADDGGVEVALVHRPRYDDWSWPKGKARRGEHPLRTAVREVAEETGHRVTPGRPLGAQAYTADGRLKIVRYWAARAGDGLFRPADEVDRLVWLSPDAARKRLAWPREAMLLDRFAAGPRRTWPLVLLRHAAAVPRSAWDGADQDRPLAGAGLAHAAALREVLGVYAGARTLTSPALRCRATAGPGAVVRGELSEGAREDAVTALVAELLGQDDGTPVVLCTHRPVAGPVLRAAGVAVPDGRGADEPLLPGEFAVLHVHRGAVVAHETHAIWES